jgi:hypothetical protein
MAERTFTDVELERFLANDLPAPRASELEARATEADRARLEELRAENQAFLARVDVDAEVRAIGKRMARLEPEPRRLATWRRWLVTGGALVAAAAAILIVVRRDTRDDQEPDLQTKGNGVSLVVHTPMRQLATGDTVHPGERIRFEVIASRRGYIAVVGVDGTGNPTVYHPSGGSAAGAIDPAAASLLPGAIELDATPGDEKFYAFYSEQPFSIDAVLPALRGGRLPPGVSSSEVVLRKQAR